MIIAFTSKGKTIESELDDSFGRTKYFLFWNSENNEIKYYDNTINSSQAHGVGTKAAKEVVESGAELVISGNMPGPNALNILEKSGMKIYVPNEKKNFKDLYNNYCQMNK